MTAETLSLFDADPGPAQPGVVDVPAPVLEVTPPRRCACGVSLADYGPAVHECTACQQDDDERGPERFDLADLIDRHGAHIGAWLVADVLAAEDDAAAAKELRQRLALSGMHGGGVTARGGPKAYTVEALDRTADGCTRRPLAMFSYSEIAEAIRAAADPDIVRRATHARHEWTRIEIEDQDDEFPFMPACVWNDATAEERAEHERAEDAYRARQDRRDDEQRPHDQEMHACAEEIAARIRAATPGALF